MLLGETMNRNEAMHLVERALHRLEGFGIRVEQKEGRAVLYLRDRKDLDKVYLEEDGLHALSITFDTGTGRGSLVGCPEPYFRDWQLDWSFDFKHVPAGYSDVVEMERERTRNMLEDNGVL